MMPIIRIVDVQEPVETPDDTPVYPSVGKDFMLAGRAYFHVTSPSGQRFSYVIRARAGKRGSEWEGKSSYLLRVFINGSYRYVGVIDEETGDIAPTGRSEFVSGTLEYDVAQWAISTIFNAIPISAGYTITHVEKCAKCGRMLSGRNRESGFHLDCTKGDTE